MRVAAAAALAALALAACGAEERDDAEVRTVTVPSEPRRAAQGLPEGRFDPVAVYRERSPGVVTVVSVFGGRRTAQGLGAGFVVGDDGEVVTNAHVVTQGEGRSTRRADDVYVQFADGNQVAARIVGTDPDYDVGLLRVRREAGLRLHPLPLGSSAGLAVGEPVAAIGSPFGERQSLSVGVISAVDRTIESLTRFQISDAIQTDAAVNRGNSGGPLLDARGLVIGINAQIRTAGGGSEGVGFAVPVDAVKRSLAQLRADGKAEYPYLGVTTVALYPQLARRLELPVRAGALVQGVVEGGPADDAGIREGDDEIRFQGEEFQAGGDVIVALNGRAIRPESGLAPALAGLAPGRTVELEVVRGGDRRTVRVRLGRRP